MKITGFTKKKGYYIDKSELSQNDLKNIKLELTVEPKIMDFGPLDEKEEDVDAKKYKLYTNTQKYIIVPRYYVQE